MPNRLHIHIPKALPQKRQRLLAFKAVGANVSLSNGTHRQMQVKEPGREKLAYCNHLMDFAPGGEPDHRETGIPLQV